MGKMYPSSEKYVIRILVEVERKVTKDDIIGAVFGQTEGLISSDMNLRELQSRGEIGRLEPEGELTYSGDKTIAVFRLSSNTSLERTVIIAAAIETVDKVGSSRATFKIDKIIDVREEKKTKIRNRAKELIKQFSDEFFIDIVELEKELKNEKLAKEIIQLLPDNDKVVAHKSYDTYDEIILVEGKADVQRLLSYDIKNVVSVGGISDRVPEKIIELSKRKTVTLFIDGDNGGKNVAKQLLEKNVKIDYIAKAPEGKEVEELSKKEIHSALKRRKPVSADENIDKLIDEIKYSEEENDEYQSEEPVTIEKTEQINHGQYLAQIVGTKKCILLYNDDTHEIIDVSNFIPKVKERAQDIKGIYIDGLISEPMFKAITATSLKYLGTTNPNAKYRLANELTNKHKMKGVKVVSIDD